MRSELELSRRQIKAALKNDEASAKIAHLIYTNDTAPGIKRVRNDNGFKYYFNNKEIKDTEELLRIKRPCNTTGLGRCMDKQFSGRPSASNWNRYCKTKAIPVSSSME